MNIKEIREKAYLTQERFAEVLGVHISTVRSWEQGLRMPSLTQKGKIVQFCKKRKISIEE